MKIVSYPENLIQALAEKFTACLRDGAVAEGHYCLDAAHEYVPGKKSIPVCSGGAAIFALLAHYKYAHGRTRVIVQSNTMRALYTVPRLLDMEIAVADSSYDDFLAMRPDSLKNQVDTGAADKTVVLYSVIGGYLSPSYAKIENFCRSHRIPLIVDAAHAHYLSGITNSDYAQIAYSFYATKILPAGEGGLITTKDQDVYEWVKRFLIYDRFKNEFEIGINMRVGEYTAATIHALMTSPDMKTFFRDLRVDIADSYKKAADMAGVRYLDFARAADFNGYKFVVLDSFEAVKQKCAALTLHGKTSAVFDTDVRGGPTTLPHWCPPTYSSLHPSLEKKLSGSRQ